MASSTKRSWKLRKLQNSQCFFFFSNLHHSLRSMQSFISFFASCIQQFMTSVNFVSILFSFRFNIFFVLTFACILVFHFPIKNPWIIPSSIARDRKKKTKLPQNFRIQYQCFFQHFSSCHWYANIVFYYWITNKNRTQNFAHRKTLFSSQSPDPAFLISGLASFCLFRKMIQSFFFLTLFYSHETRTNCHFMFQRIL